MKDSDFCDQIYASAPNHRDKFEFFVKSPDSNNATGFTVNHALHRLRHEALGPFFSKRNVAKLKPQINAKRDRLCERLDEYMGVYKPVNFTVESLALTMDILTENAFAEIFRLLKQEDFNVKWRCTILGIMQALLTICLFFFGFFVSLGLCLSLWKGVAVLVPPFAYVEERTKWR